MFDVELVVLLWADVLLADDPAEDLPLAFQDVGKTGTDPTKIKKNMNCFIY